MQLYSQHGRWYVFAYSYDPRQDRRVRVKRSTGVRDDGSRAAKERAGLVGEQIARNIALGRVRQKSKTLKEALQLRIDARELADKSAERTLYAARALFEVLGPDTPIDQIDEAALVRYARVRLVSASADTVRRELAELRPAMRLAKVPLPAFPELPPSKPRERWLTPEECIRLLEAAPPHRKMHIVAYLQCGLRRNELYAMEPVSSNEARFKGTKTEKADRVLPLTELASEALKSGLRRWTNGNRDLKRYAAKAGLGPVSFNDLRRTFCTHLAIAGVSPLILKELLGHSSTRMVDRVYARVKAGKHLHDAVALLPRTFAGQTGAAGSSETCSPAVSEESPQDA